MIRSCCPVCSRAYAIAGLDELPSFPFCSDRCRLIDLGRWIDEKYAIPDPQINDGEGEADANPDAAAMSGADATDE